MKWRNVAKNIKPHNVSALKLTMIIYNEKKKSQEEIYHYTATVCHGKQSLQDMLWYEKHNTFHHYNGGHF